MKIPIYGRAEAGEPLRNIVSATARAMGMSDTTVAILMTYFLQHLTFEVTSGEGVSIPGFGMFAAHMWHSRAYPELCYPQPRFYPARGFRNDVKLGLGPTYDTERRIGNYTKNHCVTPGVRQGKAGNASAARILEKYRREIENAAKRIGLDPYDNS